MKLLALTLIVVFSSSAFARQYIQCHTMDSSDVMVVNLKTINTGTLFISSGMENPEDQRILMDIIFSKKENGYHNYKISSGPVQGSVNVPSDIIGKSSDYAKVELSYNGFNIDFSCFARIYND